MSQGTELRKLLPELEELPEETREGLVKFLKLVLSVDRTLRTVQPEAGELQEGEINPVPAREEGDTAAQGFRELLRFLGQNLQGQQPERRDLVLAVLASSGKAYDLGQESSGRLLLQLAIIMTAGQEDAASAAVQDLVSIAAQSIAKIH
jgi:hypothetical protein